MNRQELAPNRIAAARKRDMICLQCKVEPAHSARSPAARLLRLQRSLGNRAIQKILGTNLIQACSPQASQVQRAVIPASAPLADFVNWTQRAIDDMDQGSPQTLSNEALAIVQGLRNHITLLDVNGNLTPGGTFLLLVGTSGRRSSVSFELIVDDSVNPPRAGTFTPPSSSGGACTITLYTRLFRGGDHRIIGDTLFHEAVHALFHLRRESPTMTLRPVAGQILSPTTHAAFRASVGREVNDMIPDKPEGIRNSITRRLAEEVLVVVETEAYQASIARTAGPVMSQAEFTGNMDRMLFQSTLFLSSADRAVIMADPIRRRAWTSLLDILYGYYSHYRFRRLARIGVSPTGIIITGGRLPFYWTPPPLAPPPFRPLPLP